MAKRAGVSSDDLHRHAQEAELRGRYNGDAPRDLIDAVAHCHLPDSFTADVTMPDVAVTALTLACPTGAEPLSMSDCMSGTCTG